ncbi:MAG: hypothetical protein ACPG4Z_05040 [Chitinophagales bacterium]
MKKSHKFLFELVWWLVAFVLAGGVLFPILSQAGYYHTLMTILVIIVSFTYVRYIIMFKTLFFLRPKWLRMMLLLGNIFLFIFILYWVEYILGTVDAFAIEDLIHNHDLGMMQQKDIMMYVKKLWMFFGVASFIGIIGFNIRLILSFWKKRRVVTKTITTHQS